VVARYADGSVGLRSPHDTVAEAQETAAYWRGQAKNWIEKPRRIDIVREGPELLRERMRPEPIGRPFTVAARWAWLERNWDLLAGQLTPKWCRALEWRRTKADDRPSDLLATRVGGRAVLPVGSVWPMFWVRLPFHGKRRKKVFGTYVGTYDLRGCFRFKRFPAAISIFLCTYNEWRDEYTVPLFASMDPQVGNVVPLYPGDDLELVEPPLPEVLMPPALASTSEVPDFPPPFTALGSCFGETPSQARRRQCIEQVYNAIEEREPGTSGWIHLGFNTIGAYESYIQNSLRDELTKKHRQVRWHFIATFSSEDIALGDSGILYILAGWVKQTRQWRWHAEWQCH
jgi:hypothetical protein